MRRLLSYLLVVLAIVVSCGSGGKVIPEKKLSRIYADMFLADQWIKQNGKTRMADTSLVYEPIFRKYGYTTADYHASVDKYQEDPDKFSKIFEQAAAILQASLDSLTKAQRSTEKADSVKRAQKKLILRAIENYGEIFSAHPDRAFPVFSMDSTGVYVMSLHLPDTTFSGPEVISNLPEAPGDEQNQEDGQLGEVPAGERFAAKKPKILEEVSK